MTLTPWAIRVRKRLASHSSLPPSAPAAGPIARARADLDFIRNTLEQAGTFTAISGVGVALTGVIGLIASGVSFARAGSRQPVWGPAYSHYFLAVWTAAVAVAIPVAFFSLYLKGRHLQLPLGSGPTRRALRSMAPGWLAAALVTLALISQGAIQWVPGFWLLLDGLALLGAATFSISPVRWMGRALAVLGILAIFHSTPLFTLTCLALGFGALHLVAGLHIARKHDG